MAMFSDLLPAIRAEVVCDTALVERTIRWTVQDFCKKTHYWQHWIDPITLIGFVENAPGTYIYPIPLPDGSRMLTVVDLVFRSKPLVERSPDWFDEHYPNWREATGDPTYFLMMSGRQVRFVPAAKEVMPVAVTGRVVLEPDNTATAYGDDLQRFDEGLVNGTLSRLMVMKNKPWTDTGRAGLCLDVYQHFVSEAKQEQMRDWCHGTVTTQKVAWL